MGETARFSLLYENRKIARVIQQHSAMNEHKHQHQNRLDYYRRRMSFTTSHVAHLLGHKDTSTFLEYERGDRLPTLVNAFRLSVILRTPVEFLFGGLYDALKKPIRSEEERLAESAQQQALF